MGTFNQPQTTTDDLYRKTAALAQAAAERGDGFLQYLYTMALQHIGETKDDPRQSSRHESVQRGR